MTRNAGIIEFFIVGQIRSSGLYGLAQVSSRATMEEFLENAKDAVAASGHVLKITGITMLNN